MYNDPLYRIVGDITIKNRTSDNKIVKGKQVEISYGHKQTAKFDNISIIQLRQHIKPESPYFVVEVQRCDPNSIISVGIAGLDIDKHTGQYNNSLGYFSNTGRVYTSWKVHANTLGRQYGKGNRVSLYVTNFGEHMSTVLLFYDNIPIATRYHFEENKERYLPTITFSGGRAEISVLWPDAATEQIPSLSDMSISKWIRAPMCTYDKQTNTFENRTKVEDLPIQSPLPLSNKFRCFIVKQEEISSTDGKGASVGLATFSPLKPTPTCSLMKDYYTWFAKTKMKVGSTIGWGVFYDENCRDDKIQQLCLVFVMFNKTIVDALFVLQPEGGFVPIVLLQPYATKVSIERKDAFTTDELHKLKGYYAQMLGPATEIYRTDRIERDLSNNLFRKSEQVFINSDDYLCQVTIPRTENTIHYLQFRQPLTQERRFFFVELKSIHEQCQVIVGIASAKHQLNEAPGLTQDSVGYNSFTGKLYSNRRDAGNMRGHKCKRGDTIGIEVQTFGKDMSVILFSKNFRPIGTRYLTLNDHLQYFPTILVESTGDPVELSVHWQTRVSIPPHYSVKNPEDWCLPEGTTVDLKEKIFILPQHSEQSLCIQAPCSLNKKYNHFEVIILDKFTDSEPPPAVALCTASPIDPPPTSQFKQDYLRFWPTGDAAKYLKQGDKVGWGILFPQDDEELIICYLTVNRVVGYVRVLYQPVGGLFPVIIAPPNINRIQMDFSAARISTEDFTPEQVQTILAEARQQIEYEDGFTQELKSMENDENNFPHTAVHENPYDLHSQSFYNYNYDKDAPPVKSSACSIL